MTHLPVILCVLSGMFYGVIWVLNKDLIWQTPLHNYHSYEAWFAANNPKGLWFTPLLLGLMLPHENEKVTLSPMSDFLWERMLLTISAICLGLLIGRWVKQRNIA